MSKVVYAPRAAALWPTGGASVTACEPQLQDNITEKQKEI